jgi:hypothetical protein
MPRLYATLQDLTQQAIVSVIIVPLKRLEVDYFGKKTT